jgi:hypothetical protein
VRREELHERIVDLVMRHASYVPGSHPLQWKTAEGKDAYNDIWSEVGHHCGLEDDEVSAIRHLIAKKASEWYFVGRMAAIQDENHPRHREAFLGSREEQALEEATTVNHENLEIRFKEGTSMRFFFTIHRAVTDGKNQLKERASVDSGVKEIQIGQPEGHVVPWAIMGFRKVMHELTIARCRRMQVAVLQDAEACLDISEKGAEGLKRFKVT